MLTAASIFLVLMVMAGVAAIGPAPKKLNGNQISGHLNKQKAANTHPV